MDTVRDKFWIWGHEAGSHNDQYGLPARSRMTPAEGAFYLGVPNILMVVYGNNPPPPFEQHAMPMRPLKRVVWSIVGDSSSKRNDSGSDLEAVLALTRKFPNVCGAIMDDFFNPVDGKGNAGRCVADDLGQFRTRLRSGARPLDLYVVLYTHQLHLPVKEHLKLCDVVTLWTWKASDLEALEDNFGKLEAIAPRMRKVLGCYMWDYGAGKPMPVDRMLHQCELGLEWLQEGSIEGMIFLASCICDLELETVEWTRRWIDQVGNQPLGPPRRGR